MPLTLQFIAISGPQSPNFRIKESRKCTSWVRSTRETPPQSKPHSNKQRQSIQSACDFNNLLSNGQEQPIPNIPQTRLEHPAIRQLLVHAGQPNLDALLPLRSGRLHARSSAKHRKHNDALGAPFAQGLNRSSTGPTRSDDRVEDDGQGGSAGPTRPGPREVVRQVVVVLDRMEGGGFAVQAEVVDGHGVGEEGLDCWEVVSGARGRRRATVGARGLYLRPCLDQSGEWERGRWCRGGFGWFGNRSPEVFGPVVGGGKQESSPRDREKEKELTNSWARGALESFGKGLAAHDQGNVVYQGLDIAGRCVV